MRSAVTPLVVVCCLLNLAAPASAGGEFQVGPAFGGAWPVGPLDDIAAQGFAYGGILDWTASPDLTYGLTALWIPFDYRKVNGVKVQPRILQAALHAKRFLAPPGSRVRVFVQAGLGAYRESVDVDGSSWYSGLADSSPEIKFGLHAGPGAQMRLGDRVQLLLGGDYHLVFDKGDGMDNSTYVLASLGLLYAFGGQ